LKGAPRHALPTFSTARAALTPEMALPHRKGVGPDMKRHLRMQLAYDMAENAAAGRDIGIKRYISVGKAGTLQRPAAVVGRWVTNRAGVENRPH